MARNNLLKFMLVGPFPPQVGGIANFDYELKKALIKKDILLFEFNNSRILKNITSSFINLKPIRYLIASIIVIKNLIRFPLFLMMKLPDVVYINTPSFFPFFESVYYVIVSRIFKRNIVLHIHGGRFHQFYKKNIINRNLVKFAIKNSTIKFFVSHVQLNVLKHDLDQNDCFVVPNGFDPDVFRPMDKQAVRDALGLPKDLKIAVTVANLVPEKGHQLLFMAIYSLRKIRKDFLLVVIGDGPLRNVLEKMISEMGLEDSVKLIGQLFKKDVSMWMNASDFFVLPSLYEGNPVVMFEALGVGLPFVGTKVGGIPEIITSEDYGLLAEPGNVQDLTDKIQVALDKQWDRRRILDYAQQFTWDKLAERVLQIYEGAMKRQRQIK